MAGLHQDKAVHVSAMLKGYKKNLE